MNPLRGVASYDFIQSRYSKAGSGSNRLRLACGHVHYQKSSIKIPTKARCHECGRSK